MTKLATTAVSIALLCASGIAQADDHAGFEAQIAKLQQEKSALATRLSNAIAFSKDRGMQIEMLQKKADSGESKSRALSSRLSNAIAFSRERGAQLAAANKKQMAMSTGISSSITQSKRKSAQIRMLQQQLDSEKMKSKALNSRLSNAIAFSKERGAQLAAANKKQMAMSTGISTSLIQSKKKSAQIRMLRQQLESERMKSKAMGDRLRNAIAFSKERGAELESEKAMRKASDNRLRNAIAFSKERAKQIEMLQQSSMQLDWAAGVSSSLYGAFGGVQGTTVDANSDNSVKIQVGNNGLFNTGSTILSESGTQLLSTIAQELLSTDANLTIVGHTDSIPVGNSNRFSSNDALSFARAVSTMEFFRNQGLPTERLSAAGHGAGSPIASNDTAEGRQQNRRVEIILRQQ